MLAMKIKNILFSVMLCITFLTGSIASCSVQSPDASAASPTAESPDPEGLYRQLSHNRREFEEGIRLIAEGQNEQGLKKTGAAQDRIVEGLRKCMDVDGCDIEIFFDAIADLLVMQQAQSTDNAVAVTGAATDTADNKGNSTESSLPASYSFKTAESRAFLRGKDLRELIELNDPVKAAMNDWLTWMRPALMASYENYQYLRDKIAPVYEEAGFPEALLFALIATETGGKVHAVSNSGAVGLMQFMSQTGKHYGLTIKDGFDMRLDPVEATKANVAFLNEQLKVLNHNLEKSLAAYNSGPNRLRRLDRKLKGADFWDSRFYNSLPGETRIYVPRILAAAWLFLHPEDYNLQFGSYRTEAVPLTLKQDTSLYQLSICLGQTQNQRDGWFRTLRNLNPRLEPDDSIKAGEKIEIPLILKDAYNKNCVEGDLVRRARELHDAKFPELIIYTVVKGDSLIKIAKNFNCSVQEIALINNLRGPRYLIRIGQKLKIPGRY
jgi:membrane-bound lytic murein transglycosylase D